ncbi:MAG: hypothetical protein MHM6MM_005611 [Cercozoa sp. M6MM]
MQANNHLGNNNNHNSNNSLGHQRNSSSSSNLSNLSSNRNHKDSGTVISALSVVEPPLMPMAPTLDLSSFLAQLRQ